MELFIPSLLVLVLSAIICFIVMPKMSPYTLGVLALSLFVVGVWQNYKMFPYEYTNIASTLKDYAPFVMLVAVILGSMVGIMLAYGVSPPAVTSIIPELPSIIPSANNKPPANNTSSIFNLAGNTNAKTNNTRRNNIASSSFKTV